jgi:hypothetical protein
MFACFANVGVTEHIDPDGLLRPSEEQWHE